MCFDALGLKVLKQQIRENAERAAQQNPKKADAPSSECKTHTARSLRVQVCQPASRQNEA